MSNQLINLITEQALASGSKQTLGSAKSAKGRGPLYYPFIHLMVPGCGMVATAKNRIEIPTLIYSYQSPLPDIAQLSQVGQQTLL